MKLSTFMDQTRLQFSLILDMLRGKSADWTEKSLAHLEVEIHKGRCLLPQPKGSYNPEDTRPTAQGAAPDSQPTPLPRDEEEDKI